MGTGEGDGIYDPLQIVGSHPNREAERYSKGQTSRQYVTIALSVKVANRPDQEAHCFQVLLPQEPRIQSGSSRTLLGTWRTRIITFANEVMDLSVQGP
jgi:hypothetical protein